MLNKFYRVALFLLLMLSAEKLAAQQRLALKEAIEIAVSNYGTIKAKQKYTEASGAAVEQARRDYLPNLNLAAQQTYGTINGQNGPLYGFGGLSVSSSGLPLDHQNWNAAFGALYLTNVNWELFAFGRASEKINMAAASASQVARDYEQEIFQHKIKVAAAYLNLIAAQQLTRSFQKNYDRADTFRLMVTTKALNGLIPGVDSSQANAQLSAASITLIKARDYEQEQANLLSQLLGIAPGEFLLDTFLISRMPALLAEEAIPGTHPTLLLYKSRIDVSEAQRKYYRTFYFPAVTMVGVLQTRGSGFGSGYAADQTDFTHSYWKGIQPNRTNYLLGIGLTWNITQSWRIAQQVKAQELITEGLQYEYTLAEQQVNAQLALAENKIKNAIAMFREVPAQVKAASDAYLQRSVLYQNGLTGLTDVIQALYALTQAETDRDIANANIWQALLLKAAATGDFNLFEKEL